MSEVRLPSRDEAARCRHDIHDAVEAVRSKSLPDRDAIVWPEGLDRRILTRLGLGERTQSALKEEGTATRTCALVLHHLLRVPNFGKGVVGDLLLAVDALLSEIERCEGTLTWEAVTAALRRRRLVRAPPGNAHKPCLCDLAAHRYHCRPFSDG